MEKNVIICPHCETEYLPGEIYLPKHFLGQPTNIEKDIEGKILWYDGLNQNLKENFECTRCGKPFRVKANITYQTELDILRDVKTDYKTNKYGDRLFLSEK